jgi:hypothetical protein
MNLYLITDEIQNGVFISAIVAAVGPRSAEAIVKDAFFNDIPQGYRLRAQEIEMNPDVHGVKYVVRKKI